MFQLVSLDSSWIGPSPALQVRMLPSSCLSGVSSIVLIVTFPSGLDCCFSLSLVSWPFKSQVTFGFGLAPTIWHWTLYLTPADTDCFMPNIVTELGPTVERRRVGHALHKLLGNLNLQFISSLTEVDAGTETLLLEDWQVNIEYRSSLCSDFKRR